MNCPHCGFPLEAANTASCPRCGQPIAGSAPANAGGYGLGMDAFSQSPTIRSSGSVPPDAGVPGENYGFAYSDQSMPPAAPYPWPGAPSSAVPPGAIPPPAPGGFSPLPPTPPRKSRTGLIIGILLVLIVLLAGGLGVSLYALNAHNHQGQAGVGTVTPAASPILSPTATSSETILFQDPLTSNTNGWANDSHCFFKNNSYHVKTGYICYAPVGEVGDANFSVDVHQVSGPLIWFYGIVFRRVSTGNFYEFNIDSNSKWQFSKIVNGTRTDILPYRPDAAIKGGLNSVNTLLVQAKGTHFQFFVNGTMVGEADDSTFSTGRSGVAGGGGGIEVAFNNFKITTAS